MLEENRVTQPFVKAQGSVLTGYLADADRQSLPKPAKGFSELMDSMPKQYPLGSSLVKPDKPLEDFILTMKSSEGFSETMVLNQLSLSTGNEVFEPIKAFTLLADEKNTDLTDLDVIKPIVSVLTPKQEDDLDLPGLVSLSVPKEKDFVDPMALELISEQENNLASSDLVSSSVEIPDVYEELDDISVMSILSAPEQISLATKLTSEKADILVGSPSLNQASLKGSGGSEDLYHLNRVDSTDTIENKVEVDSKGLVPPVMTTDTIMARAEKSDKAENATSWGVNSASSSMTTSTQAGFNSSGGQSQSQQYNQMILSQEQQQQLKSQMLDEKLAAKSIETSGDKEKLSSLIGDISSPSDKRAMLSLIGLQSINTPVRHPQWGQALGQKIVVMANNQIQEAKIMLNPEKLGPVQIKLSMDKDQQLHVSMYAQQAVTREAMESALPKLKEMLDQAGINFGSLDMTDQKQFEQNQKDEAIFNAVGDKNLSTGEELDEKPTVLVTKTDNLVDYYV